MVPVGESTVEEQLRLKQDELRMRRVRARALCQTHEFGVLLQCALIVLDRVAVSVCCVFVSE